LGLPNKQALETRKDQNRMKNYYQILEVEPDAPQDKIKEQYLFLIQAWHPDKFSHPAQKTKAEEKTKDINAAYEILRNSVKRAEYDRSTRSQSLTKSKNTTVVKKKHKMSIRKKISCKKSVLTGKELRQPAVESGCL
jgi:curved DNA-binding protein CbpA